MNDEGLGGLGVLRCDGIEVARGVIGRFTPSGFNAVGVGLTCGYEWGPAVGTGYEAPFAFEGTILKLPATVKINPASNLRALTGGQSISVGWGAWTR